MGFECTACVNYQDGVKHDENAEERVRNRFKECGMRYVYYFQRWDANHKAQEKEVADLCNIKGNLVEVLEKKHCCNGGGFKFLTEAWKQIVECRRFLKWTYVYGYYMPEHANSKTTLFEYLQGEAEMALERLHDCAENTLNLCLKFDDTTNKFETLEVELLDRTAVTKKHFKNLLQGISDGLPEVEGNPRWKLGRRKEIGLMPMGTTGSRLPFNLSTAGQEGIELLR
ncbi:putative E3 ubiquitin-protein ligase ARI5 [Heracleum sosnowskyi]|uniref:E3 ubiquitin-protein ligase ARI5 n=1 Tax=Heracleum sosnowskyi TaxID=360622 RepID=A0AAD8IVR7_9APIA|nr:putative E3 ubiquitin-protein ligase ARI5 [Heracleum sosnowskyi]